MKNQIAQLKQAWWLEEESLLRETFERCAWSLTEAAKLLSCTRSTLQRTMRRHLELDEERQELMEYGSIGGRSPKPATAKTGRAA